jgi:hypothetical protein
LKITLLGKIPNSEGKNVLFVNWEEVEKGVYW